MGRGTPPPRGDERGGGSEGPPAAMAGPVWVRSGGGLPAPARWRRGWESRAIGSVFHVKHLSWPGLDPEGKGRRRALPSRALFALRVTAAGSSPTCGLEGAVKKRGMDLRSASCRILGHGAECRTRAGRRRISRWYRDTVRGGSPLDDARASPRGLLVSHSHLPCARLRPTSSGVSEWARRPPSGAARPSSPFSVRISRSQRGRVADTTRREDPEARACPMIGKTKSWSRWLRRG